MFLKTTEVAIAAPAVAAVSALMGAWLNSRNEERRAERAHRRGMDRFERESKRLADRGAKDQALRWTDNRREVHAQFLAATDGWIRALDRFLQETMYPPEQPAAFDTRREDAATRDALFQLELLVGKSTRRAATALLGRLQNTDTLAAAISEKPIDGSEADIVKLRQRLVEAQDLRQEYLDLAQGTRHSGTLVGLDPSAASTLPVRSRVRPMTGS
jgi:hypothetical protein